MKGEETAGRIASILTCLMFIGCATTPIQEEHSEEKGKVSYAIVKVDRLPGIKVSLDVRLSERVTRERLIEIAKEIRSQPNNQEPRTFICYYLPGMQIGHGAWATSHFDPELNIGIFGTTKEEQERLSQEASLPVAENVIGRWMDNETGFPGVISLLKEDGKLFLTQTFKDGSKGKYEMVVYSVVGQTRYRWKDRPTSDYLVITATGDLAHGDDEGIWATSKKIK